MAADSISSSFVPLITLTSLITSSLASLESACKDIGVPWPSLDEPSYLSKTGISREDVLRTQNDAIVRASATIIAAATQLVSAVREPGLTAAQAGFGFQLSSSIRVATELHAVDILRDAGPQGLHVEEIATKVQVDPAKLARILRLLATHHVFTEVRPDVFANNRVSAALEKGQSIEALLENPAGKYDRPESAFAAMVCQLCDDAYKASTNVFETLVNPDTAFSGAPSKCACMTSKELNPTLDISTPKSNAAATGSGNGDEKLDEAGPTMWEVIARPDPPVTRFGFVQERLRRFGVAMEGGGKVLPVEEVLAGFDFASLPPSSVIVDVGGGVGTVAQILARKYQNLKIIVQDREEVCAEGVLRWKDANPKAFESGQVAFQAQSFFAPQPKDIHELKPAAFLVKHIFHDWSDQYCLVILKHLRDAAGRNGETRLLVIDYVVSYACRASGENDNKDGDLTARRSIPGVYQDLAQPPLLGNWGTASAFPYFADLNMLCLLNGQERTLTHTCALYQSAGWEVVKVTQSRIIGQPLCLVEAKAV